jgi:type I restriction enzyme M protein
MAIKKSDLYSSLWAGADALRGGMDASQYKDYVLVILFLKYVSDKAKQDKHALIEVPPGCSFEDISKLKGHKDIGERLDIAIGKIAKANDLTHVIDVISFNDEQKLGKGKEMVDRLSELIAIFENPNLNFAKNKAVGDDILGDAYEYLMRHFATESGKAKGQFYTPAEVSRIMAQVMGIKKSTKPKASFYDPTCGSGSLLLKVADEFKGTSSLFGQEKDVATAALATMNMILHNNPTASIQKGQSTLSNPLFLGKDGYLMTFDYISSNPPFSLKNWSQGFNPKEDDFHRFDSFGMPPDKNGDYAFLLHVIASLKSTGKGAIILPHGVLFRGNAEAEIRKNIIKKRLIKGIIGLPSNLFYGTGIPACIIIIDKEDAENRKGIFMIDASKGFMKDGNKNRLREQDIHKIVDVFNNQIEIPKYSRMIPIKEIADPKNDYNLNIPRYIDSQEAEDIQDIYAHIHGGIPIADIDSLGQYWEAYPKLRKTLFKACANKHYVEPIIEKDKLNQTIFNHPDFTAFTDDMSGVFGVWAKRVAKDLKALDKGCKPKEIISELSEGILKAYNNRPLIDKYDMYQHLLDYWNEIMQDDLYLIAEDGWVALPYRIIEKNKKTGKETDKGWTCDLIPPSLMKKVLFGKEQQAIEQKEATKEQLESELQELIEEHSGDDGVFSDIVSFSMKAMQDALKALLKNKGDKEDIAIFKEYIQKQEAINALGKEIKQEANELDKKALNQYAKLTANDVKAIVVEQKWIPAIQSLIDGEMERISQRLTGRIKELIERYESPLPDIETELKDIEKKVKNHLQKMGYL